MITYIVDWLFLHLLFVFAFAITFTVFGISAFLVLCYGLLKYLATLLSFRPADDGYSPGYNPLQV